MNKIEKARQHLNELCKNPDRFTMCIPPQKDDSDIIFSEAFSYAERQDKKIEKLKSLLLLTDPVVSHVRVSIVALKQWEEFIKVYPEEK